MSLTHPNDWGHGWECPVEEVYPGGGPGNNSAVFLSVIPWRLPDTSARFSNSDGQVEPESVVESAHEIKRHVTDQMAHPFDSDRSHLFGLCLGIAVQSRLGGFQQNLEREDPFRVRCDRNYRDNSTSKPCRSRVGAIIADDHSRPDPGCLDPDDVTEIHQADFSATHQLLYPVGNSGIPRLVVTMIGPLIKCRRVVR